MKVIILAGGLGTRIADHTESIPKPMVTIGGKPILWHIMKTYAYFGYKDFFLALGYRSEVIKDYFLRYRTLNADFTVHLATGKIEPHLLDKVDWNVTLVDTGLHSMTGGRVKRMQPYIGNEAFLLTYGDGLADIDLYDLIKFHKSHKKLVTVTAVRPAARFGELALDGDSVSAFKEKPQLGEGWINGGYFVIEPEFFELIDGDQAVLEQDPLEQASKAGELMAYRHEGFWRCMDTKRDRDHLEEVWKLGDVPWKQ